MNSNDLKVAILGLTFLLFIPVLALGPIFTVWSIQVLFRSERLELNLQSWCAALWLMTVLNGLKFAVKKNGFN